MDPSEDTQDRLSSPDVEESVFCPEDISTLSANDRRVFADDESSDDADSTSSYVSEDDQIYNMGSHIDNGVSVVDSDESHSEGDMDLEYKFEEDDDLAAPATLSRSSELFPPPQWPSSELHRIFLEQHDKKRLLEAQSQQDSIQDARKVPHQSMGSDHTSQVNNYEQKSNTGLDVAVPLQPYTSASFDARKEEEPVLFTPNAQPATRAESYKLPEPPEPRMDHLFNPSGMFDDMVFGHMDSSIPPRPAAPRPMQWNMLDYNSPFSPRKSMQQNHAWIPEYLLTSQKRWQRLRSKFHIILMLSVVLSQTNRFYLIHTPHTILQCQQRMSGFRQNHRSRSEPRVCTHRHPRHPLRCRRPQHAGPEYQFVRLSKTLFNSRLPQPL